MEKIASNYNIGLAFVGSLTLGLAPFSPEPHLFGKVRWILGGAKGMQAMDWFDFLMHGAPFFVLFILLGVRLSVILKSKVAG